MKLNTVYIPVSNKKKAFMIELHFIKTKLFLKFRFILRTIKLLLKEKKIADFIFSILYFYIYIISFLSNE